MDVKEKKIFIYNTYTDADLWSLIRQEDKKAFMILYENYLDVLYAYGMKLIRDESLVKDCIQDLFLQIWKNRRALNEITSVKFYLLKSLRRKMQRTQGAFNFKKVFTRIPKNYSLETIHSSEYTFLQNENILEQKTWLFNNINKLPERQREVIYLKYLEGLSHDEIAQIMGISTQSSYNLASKAMSHLKKCFCSAS